ncbi:P-loop NTPase family protein [Alkaliphilus serpentinus]|uniref:ParA family protein n=1 Tax=Alkaliphilus serpentinus TaxID=1482731 RepID=A0A833HLA7_9FIRM|nr:ParA family protein [Alkaliphilus serpentinus]KAB3525456.1 ParA family protein [Alkaliphilus serpentinus]
MLISFWSTVNGQTATTTNTIAIALMTALEYRFKILLTHNHFERSTLETSLFEGRYIQSERRDLSDIGIDALSRFIKFNKIDKENFSNYATTILKNRMDVLFGTNKTNRGLFNSELEAVIDIFLTSARDYYDLIFFDLAAGENRLSNSILEASDLIIVNLNQNLNLIEDFFNKHPISLSKAFFLIGIYDKDSRYNLKVLKRKYKELKNSAVVPYNREFADSCNEGRAVEFLLRNLEAPKDDRNYDFIKELRNTTKLLLSATGVDIHLKKLGD